MIHEQLKLARLQAGKTQKEVADAMGTYTSHISAIERGSKSPNLSVVLKYCQAIGAKLEINLQNPR